MHKGVLTMACEKEFLSMSARQDPRHCDCNVAGFTCDGTFYRPCRLEPQQLAGNLTGPVRDPQLSVEDGPFLATTAFRNWVSLKGLHGSPFRATEGLVGMSCLGWESLGLTAPDGA